jgi:signal transduction histidine kinase
MLAPRAAERGLSYEAAVERDPALHVLADRRRLTQVLANLLSNAVKYNAPGGAVRVSAQRREGHVEIVVADEGPGLDAAQLARIFQPFQRLGAEKSSVEGAGLGLALSRHLAGAMAGELRVASEPGRGTVLTLILRAAG